MKRIVFALLIGALGVGILTSLGVWQVNRLAWKEGILADIEARIAAEPVTLPNDLDPVEDRYLPVEVQGVLGDTAIRVLVSQKQVGAGYLIIQALDMGGRVILLDRGFVSVQQEFALQAGQTLTVRGNVHWPDDLNSSTPEPDLSANIWFARDLPALSKALGTEPTLVVAREITPSSENLTPLPVDTTGIPNDHLQYAVTWFGLAIVWLIMSLYYLLRTRRKES